MAALPPAPRKLRELRRICIGLAMVQASYVLVIVLFGGRLYDQISIFHDHIWSLGCRVNPALRPFCGFGHQRATIITLIVPVAFVLGHVMTMVMVPLAIYLRRSLSEADRHERTAYLTAVTAYRGRHALPLDISYIVLLVLALVVTSLWPSRAFCAMDIYAAHLASLCPDSPPLKALFVPFFFWLLTGLWCEACYFWRASPPQPAP